MITKFALRQKKRYRKESLRNSILKLKLISKLSRMALKASFKTL